VLRTRSERERRERSLGTRRPSHASLERRVEVAATRCSTRACGNSSRASRSSEISRSFKRDNGVATARKRRSSTKDTLALGALHSSSRADTLVWKRLLASGSVLEAASARRSPRITRCGAPERSPRVARRPCVREHGARRRFAARCRRRTALVERAQPTTFDGWRTRRSGTRADVHARLRCGSKRRRELALGAERFELPLCHARRRGSRRTRCVRTDSEAHETSRCTSRRDACQTVGWDSSEAQRGLLDRGRNERRPIERGIPRARRTRTKRMLLSPTRVLFADRSCRLLLRSNTRARVCSTGSLCRMPASEKNRRSLRARIESSSPIVRRCGSSAPIELRITLNHRPVGLVFEPWRSRRASRSRRKSTEKNRKFLSRRTSHD